MSEEGHLPPLQFGRLRGGGAELRAARFEWRLRVAPPPPATAPTPLSLWELPGLHLSTFLQGRYFSHGSSVFPVFSIIFPHDWRWCLWPGRNCNEWRLCWVCSKTMVFAQDPVISRGVLQRSGLAEVWQRLRKAGAVLFSYDDTIAERRTPLGKEKHPCGPSGAWVHPEELSLPEWAHAFSYRTLLKWAISSP